ncbi:MAG: DUF4369 domain-containing protein [Ferruginibacter sp.]
MKNIVTIAICTLFLFSCRNNEANGKFTVTGDIKNAPDQKIFLEELFFSGKDPEVLDTEEVKNGHFTVSGIAPDEGMYRLRLEKFNNGFLFINDKPDINFTADLNDPSLSGPSFNTPANDLLKNFIVSIDAQQNSITTGSSHLDELKDKYASDTSKAADSIVNAAKNKYALTTATFKKYIINYIDSSSDPVMTMFALGYIRDIDPTELEKPVNNLLTPFS